MTETSTLTLPDWLDRDRFYRTQLPVVEEAVRHFRDGVDLVLLHAEPGFGKTPTAEAIRQTLNVRGLYVCATLSLEEQVRRDFPYARVIKGRRHYTPTDAEEDPFGNVPTCEDCDLKEDVCSYCIIPARCPYRIAKEEALVADLGIANTAYFISECSSLRSKFTGQSFVVLDEADIAEDVVAGQVSISISKRMQGWLGLRPPERKTVEESWARWFEYAIPEIQRKRNHLPNTTLPDKRRRATLQRLLGSMKKVADEIQDGNWVYEYSRGQIEFKPVTVKTVAPEALWKHGRRWLAMSATLVPEEFIESMGWTGSWGLVSAPSLYAKENRPIYYCPVARMTKKAEEEEWPKMARGLWATLERFPNERILVHTHSFGLTKYLAEEYMGDRPLFHYLSAKTRDAAIARYDEAKGAVLLAPSLDRGFDGKDDRCRVVVITKVPWPSLGDKQVSKRLHSPGGDYWMAAKVAQSLMQMVGRGLRCFDRATELLTSEGWIPWDQISPGMTVYGMKEETKQPFKGGSPVLLPHKVIAVHHYEEPQPMLSLRAKSLDAKVTPDHSLIIQTPKLITDVLRCKKPYGERLYEYRVQRTQTSMGFRKLPARNLPTRFKLPLAGRVTRHRVRIQDEWFWLMGIIISDGWFASSGPTVGIVQSKPETISLIRQTLEGLHLAFRERQEAAEGSEMKVKDGPTYIRNYDKTSFVISGYDAARVRDVFFSGQRRRYTSNRSFGRRTRRSATKNGYIIKDGWKSVDKTIPRWVLQRASRNQMIMLLHGLMAGDGTWKDRSRNGDYYTSDKGLVDGLQELTALTGFRSTVRQRRGRYEVSFCARAMVDCPRNTVVQSADPAPAWCVTTELGNILVRRNGTTFLAGNSEKDHCTVVVLDSMYAEFFNKWKGRKQWNEDAQRWESNRHRLFANWMVEATEWESELRFELRQATKVSA